MTYFAKDHCAIVLPSINDKESLDNLFLKFSKEIVEMLANDDADKLPCLADNISGEDQETQVNLCLKYLSNYCESIDFGENGASIVVQSNSEDDTSDDDFFYYLLEILLPYSKKEYCIIYTSWFDSPEGLGSSARIGRIVNGSFVHSRIDQIMDEFMPTIPESIQTRV
jgi:hypothetical protein